MKFISEITGVAFDSEKEISDYRIEIYKKYKECKSELEAIDKVLFPTIVKLAEFGEKTMYGYWQVIKAPERFSKDVFEAVAKPEELKMFEKFEAELKKIKTDSRFYKAGKPFLKVPKNG